MADSSSNQSSSYASDPILRYRPPFAQSLPVQILTTGIVLTLVVVLLLHLIFTAQYHWPIARLNYILQLTGVITLLASVIATLYVVFMSTVLESQHWPYMLSYLAVDMPKVQLNGTLNTTDPTVAYQTQWTFAQIATWTAMNATTSVIVQITHIHFLTLLYPSDLEAKLIFFTLGPLAIISAVMQLLPLIAGPNAIGVSEGVRNVCNAALSLLFTSSLVIWGFFVNRKQAWRTDGGTAAFGAGAIILALISTTLNFIYIPRQDQYTWMPKLMWAVVLWQSFLGWWWWVGAGVGVREVEESLAKEHKRQQKRKLREQRRKEQRERARSVWKGVTSTFKPTGTSVRTQQGEESDGGGRQTTGRAPSSTTGTAPTTWRLLHPVHLAQSWFARLRHDHLTAAHLQAVERVERIHQVFGREEARNSMREPGAQVVGWGLGHYGVREAERERREELGADEEIAGPSGSKVKNVDNDDEFSSSSGTESDGGAPSQDRYRDQHVQLRRRSTSGHHYAAPQSSPSQTSSSPTEPRSSSPPARFQEVDDATGSSMWWWGPLRKWRLQDSTTYR
ncbi:hypothetical protein BKA82DRAFT_995690 [Pisolithus tinctorius]|uniref:Uncharacterized protein n=1 Tax=Pisolithus tinctorius Marx 270 TaxID=870435 RepID=A0A0C3KLL2_PISTI|nr:hypothetical protein BKA82DRAFT_995690 [Pisolithus tinctorius]KIO10497.1 hypothetical protein M404DRAFT_995690 [Pisolithus tinctorius Marx 270]